MCESTDFRLAQICASDRWGGAKREDAPRLQSGRSRLAHLLRVAEIVKKAGSHDVCVSMHRLSASSGRVMQPTGQSPYQPRKSSTLR